jgi:hypothetical protein
MPLPRLHLFELEDLPWFPRILRDFATDYLQFIETFIAFHQPAVPLVQATLRDSSATRIVDLCSGGGGPVLALCSSLSAAGGNPPILLTDKFPNLQAFAHLVSQRPADLEFASISVDATAVPARWPGLRTMFNAFHHFAPVAARAVLQSAVDSRQPICIFELSERRLVNFLLVALTPVYVLLSTPFLRPFRWDRLLLTYILPLIPLTCLWDGMVSQSRAYTVAELHALTEGLDTYHWQAGRRPINPLAGYLTFLTGRPR